MMIQNFLNLSSRSRRLALKDAPAVVRCLHIICDTRQRKRTKSHILHVLCFFAP